MARPKSTHPKSAAQRQAEYRERKKARGLVRKTEWKAPEQPPPPAAPGPEKKPEDTWRQRLRDEELKAARQAGRKKERDKHYRTGYLRAMISVCGFFIRRGRPDIARALVSEYNITRPECVGYGFDTFDLNEMDRHGIFDTDKE
jgi:hypothetical protein